MKIICAGSIKTGTKSLHEALAILGYKVYDFQDHFYYLHDDWFKVFEGKATVEDFRRMYKDIDAGVDVPFFHYWREMSEAFPNAKVILTIRENEEAWNKSYEKQITAARKNLVLMFLVNFTPIGRKWLKFGSFTERIIFRKKPFSFFDAGFNKMLQLQNYRQHNAYVLQCAPKDQLLVFNCKEGWKPLCKFLDVPVPENIPFPHKNAKADVFEESMNHPLFLELQRQLKIFLFIFFVISAIVLWILFSRFY